MESTTNKKPESRSIEIGSNSIINNISHYLPSIQMFFVFLPLTLYSIFTMGMSPVDPELRTGYYSLFLVLIPLCFSIGFFIGGLLNTLKLRRFNIRNPLMVLFDILIALSIVSCIIWFEYKFSLWPWGDQGDYIGWDWQSHYQQSLLQILFALLSIRSGIGMSYAKFRRENPNTEIMSTILLSTLLLVEYFIAFVSDSWIMLYYIAFAYSLLFPALNLLAGSKKTTDDVPYPHNNQEKPHFALKTPIIELIFVQIPIIILLPFAFLTQNCFLGMIYITHYWSSDWLKLYALIFGMVGGTVNIIQGKLNKRYYSNIKSKTQIIMPSLSLMIGSIFLLLIFQLLNYNIITALDVVFVILTPFGIGANLNCLILLLKKLMHLVSKYILLFFCILLGSVGYAGGLAYYYYEPMGLEYGGLILSWLTVIIFAISAVCMGIQLALIKKGSYEKNKKRINKIQIT